MVNFVLHMHLYCGKKTIPMKDKHSLILDKKSNFKKKIIILWTNIVISWQKNCIGENTVMTKAVTLRTKEVLLGTNIHIKGKHSHSEDKFCHTETNTVIVRTFTTILGKYRVILRTYTIIFGKIQSFWGGKYTHVRTNKALILCRWNYENTTKSPKPTSFFW